MRLKYSSHAKDQLKYRKISLFKVRTTIKSSHNIIPSYKDRKLFQRKFNMKIKYDKTTDSVYFHFNSSPYSHSKKITDGVVVDISKTGKPMGIEILEATKIIKGFNPSKIPTRYAI